uniref:Uncharacterized protein n=1 Tax=Coxiella burnetii TaxID=777 RepID=Q06HD8_COXBE|nr:hypothetical protein [Coxiella burnetii]
MSEAKYGSDRRHHCSRISLRSYGLLVETATFNRARPLTLTCLKSTIPLSLGVFTRGLI